jgi:hypothetical protein
VVSLPDEDPSFLEDDVSESILNSEVLLTLEDINY